MKYVIVTTSLDKRKRIIQDIREKLTKAIPPDGSIKMAQSQVNKIDLYHKVNSENFVIFRSYIVIVIPVIVNLNALNELYGDLFFDCSGLINELYGTIKRLRGIEGKTIRRLNNAKFKGLAEGLYGIPREYRASKDIRQVDGVLDDSISPPEEDSSLPWED